MSASATGKEPQERFRFLVDEVAPVLEGPLLLRRCAHYLAQLATRNPLMVQTSSWQMASEGLARLCREIDELRNVIAVDFSDFAVQEFADPNQLLFRLEDETTKYSKYTKVRVA